MTPELDRTFLRVPFAHRALHDVSDGRPENSRAAINAAIEHGYGIEIDLQLSADDQAMVFHDYDLARLAKAEGPVRDLTADALAQTPLRGGNEGIATLSEILVLVAGQVPLLIEIKDQDGAMGPTAGVLEAATAAALRGYKGPLALMSFNPHAVAHMADLCPDIPRGLVTADYAYDKWDLPADVCDRLRDIPDYERVGASFISHEVTDLTSARVTALKRSGAKVFCWTVRSAQVELEARKLADNVTFEGYLAKIPG